MDLDPGHLSPQEGFSKRAAETRRVHPPGAQTLLVYFATLRQVIVALPMMKSAPPTPMSATSLTTIMMVPTMTS